MEDKVVLLDMWASACGMRVRVALAEKGIEYEYKEENLADKSHLLLESNPVHKLIPVLIHNEKPVCESLIIVEYIDEVWSHKSPLLPSDPYERTQARFWADYVDNKIYETGRVVWRSKGEEQKKLKKEFIEYLKTIEEQLGDKPYFGGESFGFVDVALIPITCWFYSYEICADISVEKECPKLIKWAQLCFERETVSKSIPDPQKMYGFVLFLKEKYGV